MQITAFFITNLKSKSKQEKRIKEKKNYNLNLHTLNIYKIQNQNQIRKIKYLITLIMQHQLNAILSLFSIGHSFNIYDLHYCVLLLITITEIYPRLTPPPRVKIPQTKE